MTVVPHQAPRRVASCPSIAFPQENIRDVDLLHLGYGSPLPLTLIFALSLPQVHLASGNAVSSMPVGGLTVSVSLAGVSADSSGNFKASPALIHAELRVIGAFDTNG